MTLRVQRADQGDGSDMVALEAVLFPGDAWSSETMAAELSHSDSYYLVVRDDLTGELVGYGGLRAHAGGGGQGDIQTMAVAASHQGQGLGRSLLDELLAEAWRRGVTEVFLEVRADNEVARGLYSRVGFHEIARRPGYYQSGAVDAIVMALPRETKEQAL